MGVAGLPRDRLSRRPGTIPAFLAALYTTMLKSLQHAFENLEEQAKDGIVDELLNRGFNVFADVAKNQWGSYCIQHSRIFNSCLY